MFSTHLIPITFSIVLASDYFRPRFRAWGWWNVLGICFRIGRPRTAVPERANRSDKNIMFPSFPLRYCWVAPLLLVGIVYGVSSDDFEYSVWVSRLNSRSGFSWLLMLHSSVQTRVPRTSTFSSFVTDNFGYSLDVVMHRQLVIIVRVRIVARLRQFSVCITVEI